MSGEFGSYMSGYLDSQIEYAAEDCRNGRDELTRLWGAFFEALEPVMHAVCRSEASDSGPDYPITENIQAMPQLKAALAAIDGHLETYRRVMQRAVRDAVDSQNTAASAAPVSKD